MRETKGVVSRSIAALALALGLAGTAHAAPLLGLVQQNPDIGAGLISIVYDPTTGAFSAMGVPSKLTVPPGTQTSITAPQSFSLAGTFPNLGGPATGSLLITGKINGSAVTLLQGTLTGVGFSAATMAASTTFEFTFAKTAGVSAFDGFSQVGVILGTTSLKGAAGAPCGPNDTRCTNDGFATADGFGLAIPEVPEPASLALLGTGLALVAARRRRR